jgi:PII-like signaling protein
VTPRSSPKNHPSGNGTSLEVIHSAKFIQLAGDLPTVIEIVDPEESIHRFMAEVDKLVREGLVTLEKVRSVSYGDNDDLRPE